MADAVSFNATPDAALLEITIPHLLVDQYDPAFDYHYIKIDSVSVTLRNAGTDTLHQITINAVPNSSNYICLVEDQFRKFFTDLALPPGQSISLYLGSFNQYNMYNIYFPTTTLCFWSSLPNDSLDHNALNNTICQNFQVLVPTLEPAIAEPLRVFPNPAQTVCTLEWPDQNFQKTQVSVINMLGQQVFNTTVFANRWDFDRNTLPAGIYQVAIISENGRRFVGKVSFN